MRHLFLIWLVVFVTKPVAGLAGDSRIVKAFHCTEISNDIARLECFDKAYSDYDIAANAPGNWRTRTEVSPIDDTITFAAVVDANKNSTAYFPTNKLFIRCRGNELELWVAWQNLPDFKGTRMISRVGTAPAVTENWIEGSPHEARFYPGNTRKLVREMMSADRFVAQLAEGKEKGETAVFNIKGLKEVSKPMQEACLPQQPPLSDDPQERRIQELMRLMKDDLTDGDG